MPRDLRHIPPSSLVEVTNRTLEGRFFLCPDEECTDLLRGVVTWAADKHAMPLVAQVWLSNHFHLLTLPEDAEHLSDFMRDLGANTAKEINRLRRRRGTFWHDRYHAIVVSDEEEAQISRLVYTLANSVKENLVEHPTDWPGVSAARHLIEGTPMRGTWYDRTKEHKLRRRAAEPDPREYTEEHELHHVQLPCWSHLSPEDYRARIEKLCDGIAEQARNTGGRPLGKEGILAADPLGHPRFFTRDPKPRFHAATPGRWRMLQQQYREFAARYRDAAEARLQGRDHPPFPINSFPPALPFYRGDTTRPPPATPPT